MSLHYKADNSHLFVNGKVIFKFKGDNKNINFPTQFCLGSIFNGFSATECDEIISVMDFVSTKMTNTIATNVTKKLSW